MSRRAEAIVALRQDELRIAARVTSVRFPQREHEQERLALVDELLRIEANLGRALSQHARHGLSESRGSHSTWDVASEAEHIFTTLAQYETIVRRMAGLYGSLVAAPPPPESNAQ